MKKQNILILMVDQLNGTFSLTAQQIGFMRRIWKISI